MVNKRICVVLLCCFLTTSYCRPPKTDKQHVGGLHPEDDTKNLNHKDETSSNNDQCLYERCDTGIPGMINMHLIPHAHNDLGYKKTVDQYYWGQYDYFIQPGAIQYILETVTLALQQNPDRRFIWVETGFLYRWWNQQNNSTKEMFKTLVNDGRMELTMGGWVSNDEGSTHYAGIIDQMTIGLRFLKDNIGGKCSMPKLAWQIDAFGHSREMMSLFAMMGFDGVFFARISYQDKARRLRDKAMELVSFGSDSLGDQSTLFTGIMYNHYAPPLELKPIEPIMDDPTLEGYDVDERVQAFIDLATRWVQDFNTEHIMVPMGEDFEYSNAFRHYINMDKAIKYTNQRQANGSNVNVIMSTPTCYMYALNQANVTYEPKYDDFMPLESAEENVWSGYFTSRSALKKYARMSGTFLQSVKKLHATAGLDEMKRLERLMHEVATMQHHDAMTGTCRQHVANDYAKRLYKGNAEAQIAAYNALDKLLPWNNSASESPPRWQICDLYNVSYCAITETNPQFSVLVYNPLGVATTAWIHVPVTGIVYSVQSPDLSAVPNQVVPLSAATLSIPDRNGSNANGELVFKADLPPLGYSTYFVQQVTGVEDKSQHKKAEEQKSEEQKTQKAEEQKTQKSEKQKTQKVDGKKRADFILENEFLQVTVDEITGLLKSITNKERAVTVDVSQTLRFYQSKDGSDGMSHSSVYQFTPNGTDTYPVGTEPVTTEFITGSEVQELRQQFSGWVSHVIRLHRGQRQLEMEFTVGPIPKDDGIGREIVSLFSTDLQTDSTFYTDSNGREMIQRRRFYQPTFNLTVNNPVSVNYYPISTQMYIQDEQRDVRLTVLTDRNHGGSSMRDGEMEIMVQRRLPQHPSSGVDEVFDEPGITGEGIVVRGRMYVHVDTISGAVPETRPQAQRLFLEPQVFFSPLTLDLADYSNRFKTQWSALSEALPANIHLLTLETWRENEVLLRLEHIYEKDEDPVMSQDASVSLRGLFSNFTINSLVEMTLAANQPLAEAKRLRWNVQGYGRTSADMIDFVVPVDPGSLTVTLKPMQIRTFILTVVYH